MTWNCLWSMCLADYSAILASLSGRILSVVFLLFLVVLGCCSRSDGVDDGVCRHVADVELEIKLVGEVLDGESAHLAAVERHCTELQLTSRRNVIPDIHHKHSLASSANDTHSTAGLNYS